MDARSPSPKRWWTAACPSAQSTRAGLVSFAIDTACAIFTRIRELPCAAASFNHNAAPSPRARNAASASLPAFGSRLIAPAGAGGKWSSSICGLPGSARACRATSIAPRSPTCTITTRSSRPAPCTRTHTVSPSNRCGTA